MDEQAFLERLDSNADDPAELFEHFERCRYDGREYRAMSSARHGVERGTVVVPAADAVVRGYPSVPRLLVLDPGLHEHFESDRVVIEEKLDGFNVRIADVDGDVWAFTRSGYVCPYTTERARALLSPDGFLDDHPGSVICAEFVGPETPYTCHDYDDVDSHTFRVFDVRDRASGAPMPVAERRERCAAYGFPTPRSFGIHERDAAVDATRRAIDELDAADREGVVCKSPDGRQLAKYTTEAQHHAELAYAFAQPFDYGRDFVFSRVVRDAFQAAERGETGDRLRERAHDLGEAILESMVETIRDVDAGRPVGDRNVVRGDPESITALLEHLRGQGLTLDVEADRRDGEERVVEFRKVSEATRDRVSHYLEGGTVDE